MVIAHGLCNVLTLSIGYVNPCTPNYCLNGGLCHEVDGEAVCDCLPGYNGSRCEESRPFKNVFLIFSRIVGIFLPT